MGGYEETGVLSLDDLLNIPSEKQLEKGVAISECIQNIPCNPCVDACSVDAISMKDINSPPVVDYDRCTACGNCVAVCPGLALFIVKIKEDKAWITLPYEFLPIPEKNDTVDALDREGNIVGEGKIIRVRKQNSTWIITVEVDRSLAMIVRNIRCRR
ncbi:MAG: (4Fe-4S)-binding protein [Thermoplasmata archaeon]|nr:MAG: (4Fe-4S)-binding protein [Thermoplasmata archaeon]HEC89290.1 4Fe-4S dicluster domain-containing protein [Thermoplasmatales archaeon]